MEENCFCARRHNPAESFVLFGWKLAAASIAVAAACVSSQAAELPPPFPVDPNQDLERTCFQTGEAWSPQGNLRSDVAIVYGIDTNLPHRIQTWRDRGYRIHVMTGVSWGHYQDYLYGRFDGINHVDEAQTVSDGRKSSHGGDVYYMCPSTNYGNFLCSGVQRALEAGAEAIHLEEPEYWVNSGYSEGFKREWRAYYNEEWQPPHSSFDAQWRASKLKYFLYRRALQQIFDHVQEFNRKTGKKVRCYVPTHSLLNYAHWEIVSPESSLARLNGCDGYIAQVWTGTSRTPNKFRGEVKERTFETAFLEYGAMQNLVRATGRSVWYLNDPIEDNPNHDWDDYKRNWECTLVASLFQPEVSQYEVAPWPERIFRARYPRSAKPADRKTIPPLYATELQVVMNALNDMKQDHVEWDCGTDGIGLVISDSLMFQRGDPRPSDEHLSHVYGLALPFLKRGMPIAPVQLENVTVHNYLKDFRVLMLTYQGMKPLSDDVHAPIVDWVKRGGVLVVCDDDSDPFNGVREWWNSDGRKYSTPREHLFEQLGIVSSASESEWRVGKGKVVWVRTNPVTFADSAAGDERIVSVVRDAAKHAKLKWRETNYLSLRRGPYLIASGLDESIDADVKTLRGRFVNLFDPELRVQSEVKIDPAGRYLLRDLEFGRRRDGQVIASACKTLPTEHGGKTFSFAVEGVGNTPAVVLMHAGKEPRSVELDGMKISDVEYSSRDRLLWIRFANESRPRTLKVQF